MSKPHYQLFNLIAPIYGMFFRWQRRFYNQILDQADEIDLTSYESVLDVGCGTGALCSVLAERGLRVTGVDAAEKMLRVARKQPENRDVQFVEANILRGLPFADKSFDVTIASYVSHGLPPADRQRLYAEMSRLSRHLVIIHDYNQTPSRMTSLIEWLEGSDYARFIKQPAREMAECVQDMKACFLAVEQLEVADKAAWYIGRPG